MTSHDTIDDDALALRALAWTLEDDRRAARLLDLTGIEPGALRARIGDPALLAAVLAFLQGHQADLLACADAIGVRPEQLVAAHERLGQ
jgi:Protein of unknown function (DUF3572)